MATVVGQLHGECDWLVKYFDVRKESFKASKKGDRQRLDFIMLAVRGKKVGFVKADTERALVDAESEKTSTVKKSATKRMLSSRRTKQRTR